MNKTAIKNFAVWARNKLIADITYKAGLIGVSEKGIAQPLPQSSKDLQFFDIGTKDYAQVAGKDIEQRNALVRAIQEKEATGDYATAFKAVVEEVAYTWFNRLIAIRFMEVNDYLPSRIRVLSSENPAKNEPDFVTTPFDTDMEFTTEEQDKIMKLKDENKLDELFRMLFIKQCNKLHEILPELFEETNNYTELLLSISFTDSDGVVYHLVHDIDEDDFNVEKEGQVEIIGWLYQYYNIEPKDETFALLKKNVKITKERIPAATQLFTPDWIVRYMVENSLGRLWVEGHPSDTLKENWKYYLEEAEQEADVQAQLDKIRAEYRNLNPEDIKVIDPCMGSGHILVYCFDVLMQIYESQGYTQRDAAQSILGNNLFGLDIDKRAAQLSYFAVMMKARQYDRRIFNREIKPHVYAIEESNGINRGQLQYFGANLSPTEKNKAKLQITGLLDTMVDAKEYGSILNVENYDWELLKQFVSSVDDAGQMTFDTVGIDETQKKLLFLIRLGQAMVQKYDIVVTNPPYAGSKGLNSKLNEFIQSSYYVGKGDLFAPFIIKICNYLKTTGFAGMITPTAWLYNPSYAQFREKQIKDITIITLGELGSDAFEVGFGTTMFVFSRKERCASYRGVYMDMKNNVTPIEYTGIIQEETRYVTDMSDYLDYDGNKFSYKLTRNFRRVLLEAPALSRIGTPRAGLQTDDNNRFIREWYEVSYTNIDFHHKKGDLFGNEMWFPHIKGGTYRKWYGNLTSVVNWKNDGAEIKSNATRKYGSYTKRVQSQEYYFTEGIAWTHTTYSQPFACRYLPEGVISNVEGPAIFGLNDRKLLVLAMLNTKIMDSIYSRMSDSIHYLAGELAKFPIMLRDDEYIKELAQNNVDLAKSEWDDFETSWDFEKHPLLRSVSTIADAFNLWQNECDIRFNQLKTNEEALNRIFIDIYGLQDELTPEVEDKDVTVRKADLQRDIKGLLSYAVGCMFGRYSLDEPGLAYAGGEWDDSKYSSFIPDRDNCIPITDEAYFEDDIVGLFCSWLKKVYGEDTLEENLDFIAKALGNKGVTSREVIRNYFLTDFIKDHNKIYQKRPIYWLFDSGKQNGFKALVYMHRWNADTVGNLRVEYLHKMQHTYEREIVRMQETIDNSRDSREVSKATKRKDKLQKQLKETKDYDAKLAHIALSRIDIDLDDGVKVNYEKVQTGRDGKKMQILAKI